MYYRITVDDVGLMSQRWVFWKGDYIWAIIKNYELLPTHDNFQQALLMAF
jgi:hypothetical protein